MYQDAIHAMSTVAARYPSAAAAFPVFNGEAPIQAILAALKKMQVSHDNIATISTAMGISLNPSTMTRIGSDKRRSTQRVLAGLCLVWAVAAEMLLRTGNLPPEDRVRRAARDLFLQAAEWEWDDLMRG